MARRRKLDSVILPESVRKMVRKRTSKLLAGDVLWGEWEVTAKPITAKKDETLDRCMVRVPVRFIKTGETTELKLPKSTHLYTRRIEDLYPQEKRS